MIGPIAREQIGGAASFDIAEIGTMLGVADQRGKIGVEVPRDLRRIDQPLQLEGLEPAKTIADDDPASKIIADIGARAMQRSAEPDQRVAGFAGRGDGRALARIAIVAEPVTARPKPGRTVLRREGRQRPHDIDLKLMPALDRGP